MLRRGIHERADRADELPSGVVDRIAQEMSTSSTLRGFRATTNCCCSVPSSRARTTGKSRCAMG